MNPLDIEGRWRIPILKEDRRDQKKPWRETIERRYDMLDIKEKLLATEHNYEIWSHITDFSH